jgi:geranylgeranyl diphosphate synthase type II
VLQDSAQKYLQMIERELALQIESTFFVSPLLDAIKYVMFPGGKRIRPLFSAFLCDDFGSDVEKFIPAAVSVEYIHAGSLVHDDLPAMDDDDVRRGRPACHRAFDEATAILCGDVLSVFPFTHLARVDLPQERRLLMVETLASAFMDLCNGQQLDMNGSENYLEMYKGKTGGLFAAAAALAAIFAGKSSETILLCKSFGYKLGQYFQVVDDFIDSNGELKGRPLSSDKRNKKATYGASQKDLEEGVYTLKSDLISQLDLLSAKEDVSAFNGVLFIIKLVEDSFLRSKKNS